jgi:hypothetical protein
MKVTTAIAWFTLLAIVCVFVAYPVWSNQVPEPSIFKPLTPQVFIGLIGGLFAAALFVERAVEVVIMVFRDQQADLLDEVEGRAAKDLENATKKTSALASDSAAIPVDKKAATDAVEAARQTLGIASHNKVLYRAETKEIALLVGLVLGTFVSLAGVRALHGLLSDTAPTGKLLSAADIVVTGAMLAGGSEGIHRMANAFTSFMDGLSARGDQVQRKANEDKKTNS